MGFMDVAQLTLDLAAGRPRQSVRRPTARLRCFVRSFVVATMFIRAASKAERPARPDINQLVATNGCAGFAKSPGSNAAIAGINDFLP